MHFDVKRKSLTNRAIEPFSHFRVSSNQVSDADDTSKLGHILIDDTLNSVDNLRIHVIDIYGHDAEIRITYADAVKMAQEILNRYDPSKLAHPYTG